MHLDQVDIAMKRIAQIYHSCLVAAKYWYDEHPEEVPYKNLIPARIGTDAMNILIAIIALEGGKPTNEPRTGVTSAGSGITRFDVVFTLHHMDIYLEVQASGTAPAYKQVQLQGQIIGFVLLSAGAEVPTRFYKIVGNPREMSRWSRRAAEDALTQGIYDAQVVMSY